MSETVINENEFVAVFGVELPYVSSSDTLGPCIALMEAFERAPEIGLAFTVMPGEIIGSENCEWGLTVSTELHVTDVALADEKKTRAYALIEEALPEAKIISATCVPNTERESAFAEYMERAKAYQEAK